MRKAFWLIRSGKLDVFLYSLRLELDQHYRRTRMRLYRLAGVDFDALPGSRYQDQSRIYPASPRPTMFAAKETPMPEISPALAAKVSQLGRQMNPDE